MLGATLQDEPHLPNVYTGQPGSELSTEEVFQSYWEAFGLRIECAFTSLLFFVLYPRP